MGKVLWPRLGSNLAFAERNVSYVSVLLDEMIAAEQLQTTAHKQRQKRAEQVRLTPQDECSDRT